MTPADISATAPATWDEDSSTIGVDVGTGASQVAAGDHVHAAGDVTSGTFAAARIPSLAISKVTNLQSELDGKQPAGSYAAASHTHDIADVTGLQSELDGKADTGHTHTFASLAGAVSGASGADLQAILEDIVTRLAALEP